MRTLEQAPKQSMQEPTRPTFGKAEAAEEFTGPILTADENLVIPLT